MYEFRVAIEPRPDPPVAGDLSFDAWVGNPPVTRYLPIEHPDGLDKVANVYVLPPVRGDLALTNGTVVGGGWGGAAG